MRLPWCLTAVTSYDVYPKLPEKLQWTQQFTKTKEKENQMMIMMMMMRIEDDADTILSTKNENALIASMSKLHRRKKNTAPAPN